MDIATSIKTCFQKYAVFSGRASRSEFWWFALFTFIGGIVTSVADVMILGYVSEDWGPLNIIFSIITTLPGIAVGARRLHDINKSGWWCLTCITPLIVVLIFFLCKKGDEESNKYGIQPTQ